MDKQKILNALEKSPLDQEDKLHWQNLLNQMSEDQMQRFYHAIVVKTDINRAANEIKTALDIINQALEEEQQATGEQSQTQETDLSLAHPPPQVIQEAINQTNITEHMPENKVEDPQAIKDKQEEVRSRLLELRKELDSLSNEVSGDVPPSSK